MKKIVLAIFLAIPLFGEDWFFKEGDSVVLNYRQTPQIDGNSGLEL